MICTEVDDLIPLLAADLLDSKVRAEMEEHLSQCASCRERFDFDLALFQVAKEVDRTVLSREHPTVDRLVTLVSAPDELSDLEKTQISDHVEHCSSCAVEISRLRLLPDNIDALMEEVSLTTIESIDANLKQIKQAFDSAHVITLSAWHAAVDDIVATSRLAAQGKDNASYSAPIILSTDDERLMLKALLDASTKEVWIYLSAEDPLLYQNVLIRPFGRMEEYLTDSSGRVNLGVVDWPDPKDYTAEIRVPWAQFTLSPARDLSPIGKSVLLSSDAGDQIRVTYSGEGNRRLVELEIVNTAGELRSGRLKIAAREAGSTEIVMIKSDSHESISLEKMKAVEKVEIFLFQ